MAGSSEDMNHEIHSNNEGDLQNPDYPNLTPEDIRFIAKATRARIGMFPPDTPWSETTEIWLKTLIERDGPITQANIEIHEYFSKEKGVNSALAISTKILAEISPEINAISIAQFKKGFKGAMSWAEYDPIASASLSKKIENIFATATEDPNMAKYFETNPSIEAGLKLIKDVLIPTKDPDIIYEKHSAYMQSSIDANANGQVILYIPFESDFTHPTQSESEKTQICEATITVLAPLSIEERALIDAQNNATLNLLQQRKNAHQPNSKLHAIVGNNISGAGFAALDSTVGEAFVIKNNGSHEHGFFLALNNFAKKEKFFEITKSLVTNLSADSSSFIKYMTLLYILHEQGHRVFPFYKLRGELAADIPSVINAIKISLAPELIGEKPGHGTFDIRGVLAAVLTEYSAEVVNGVADNAWFEGYKANKGNDLFDGYVVSAVVIVNAMAESGLVRVNREGMLDLNITQENLFNFTKTLEHIDIKIHANDKITLDKIQDAICTPEAFKIVDLYRQRKKMIEFTH